MRKIAAVIVLALALVPLACKVSPGFLRGIEAGWGEIGPEYKAYVQADQTISDELRAKRLRTAAMMDGLIEREKAR